MALTTDQATRLSNLLTARDALISGQQTAAVEYNGQRTEYARADMARLDREIMLLQAAATSATGRTRGAIGFRL